MATVFTSQIAVLLQKTLNKIADSSQDEGKSEYKTWMRSTTMDSAFFDDQEMGGPGLAAEVSEGESIPEGNIAMGATTRYSARKFGLRLNITEEVIEDNKYPQAIRAGKRLMRALRKTMEIDAASVLNRGFSTSYPVGDGLALWSASHTLPGAVGTYSNLAAVAMSPSRLALQTMITQAGKLPDSAGLTNGYQVKEVLHPYDQWAVWRGILNSAYVPESDRNEINVVKNMDIESKPLRYWDTSTTRWAVTTDAEDGFQFCMRREPRSRSKVDEAREVMAFIVSARWGRGITNPRYTLGVDA